MDRGERNRQMVQAWNGGQTITQISQRFGLSLNRTGRVLRDAGAKLPEVGRGIKCDLDADEVVRQYDRLGMTVRAIAAAHDVSYGKVYRLLQAEGVRMRPRGGP